MPEFLEALLENSLVDQIVLKEMSLSFVVFKRLTSATRIFRVLSAKGIVSTLPFLSRNVWILVGSVTTGMVAVNVEPSPSLLCTSMCLLLVIASIINNKLTHSFFSKVGK